MENRPSKVHNYSVFDWNDLKYFLAVARNGSTLAAARALGTSQSTVHRRLQELERRLGCPLIKRHPTGYRLTELGSLMVTHAERVEEAVVSFERNLTASDQNLFGTVRLTCPEAFGYRLMRSSVLDKFTGRFPSLRVEFVMSDQVLDLAKGEADIAIRGSPSTDGRLIGRKIADLPWAVYASSSYIRRCGRITCFEDINNHSVIEFDGQLRTHHAARWLKLVAPNAQVAARSVSLPSLLLGVKSGVGLAPLPIIVGDGEDDLACMLGTIPDLLTPFYLFMHEDMKQTPRVRAFFDFVIDELEAIRAILGGKARQ
jgi:DNA-binding transcriptional LysR family regulator